MRIRAFQGLVPVPPHVAEVACVPYDVVDAAEAAALAAGRPRSLLHVDRAEIDLPPGTDPDSDAVYAKARENFLQLQAVGVLVRESKFKLPAVIDLMTRRAANVLKLPAGTLAPEAAADICLFDPEATWTYDAATGFSKSRNSPWNGQQLTGRVTTTIVGGKIVYAKGKITA